MPIQSVKDYLIDHAPGTIEAYWACDDPIGTTTPALTYPPTTTKTITLEGAPDFQKPEPFAGAGSMLALATDSDKLTLPLIDDDIVVFLLHLPTPAEDSVVSDSIYNGVGKLGLVLNPTYQEGARRGGVGNNYQASYSGVIPVVVSKVSGYIRVYSDRNTAIGYSLGYATSLILNGLKGVRVSHVMHLSNCTLAEAQALATTAFRKDIARGVPSPEVMMGLFSPRVLLGRNLDNPRKALVERLGDHHIDGSPLSLLTDPNCDYAEVWVQQITDPTVDQTISVEINVDTLFSIAVVMATKTLTVNGVSGIVTDFSLVKFQFKVASDAVTVTIRHSELDTLVLSTTIALTTSSTKLSRLDMDLGEFNATRAKSFGNYITPPTYMTDKFEIKKGIVNLVGALAVSTGNPFSGNVSNPHQGVQYYKNYGVIYKALDLPVTTGVFSIAMTIFTSSQASTATTTRTSSAYVNISSQDFSNIIGEPVLIVDQAGATPLMVTQAGNKLRVYRTRDGSDEVVVTVPHRENVSVVLTRNAANDFKVFINGVEAHTEGNYITDMGWSTPNLAFVNVGNIAPVDSPTGKAVAFFTRELTSQEITDVSLVSRELAPTTVYNKLLGSFANTSQGTVWVLRRDTGEVVVSDAIDSEGRYDVDTAYQGDFIVIGDGSDASGEKLSSVSAQLNGNDPLPASVATIGDGSSGTHKIQTTAYLGGVKHKAVIYVFRKDTMELLARHNTEGGDVTVKFDYLGDVRVVEVLDNQTRHWLTASEAV